jgi:hypothetical protein
MAHHVCPYVINEMAPDRHDIHVRDDDGDGAATDTNERRERRSTVK